jgi:hypothetical protein
MQLARRPAAAIFDLDGSIDQIVEKMQRSLDATQQVGLLHNLECRGGPTT